MTAKTDNIIVAIVGMTGSGKSIVADELVKDGFQYLRFGQITLDIIKERKLPPTEEYEKEVRESIRKEHGMGAYAILNIPKIENLLSKGKVVVDGLYSWTEYKVLKEKYGNQLIIIAVYAPPKYRYQRLEKRVLKEEDINMRNRPATTENAQKRDYAELENVEKGGPIAMADFTVLNTGSVDDLKESLQLVLKNLY